ncbi:MAG: IPTL-CTERM sorting domain-containing protein [Lysobacterales bacterium]
MKPRLTCLLLVATTLLLMVGNASAAVIYTFDGDARTGWIVDTDTATFTSFSTAEVSIGYPVSVRDTVILAGRDDIGSVEYDLSGVATGNTWVGGDNFSELLDGTTDGLSANYGIECCGATNSVTVADLTWENQSVLFDLPQGTGGSGIAFDSSTGSLWVTSFDDELVTNYSLAGDVLSSFPHGLAQFDACCLAYDESDDTLWMGENGSNILRQFSKNGVLLDTVSITGWSPGNQYSAEMAMSGSAAVLPTTPVPSLSNLGLGVLALLLGLLGVGVMRRQFI